MVTQNKTSKELLTDTEVRHQTDRQTSNNPTNPIKNIPETHWNHSEGHAQSVNQTDTLLNKELNRGYFETKIKLSPNDSQFLLQPLNNARAKLFS